MARVCQVVMLQLQRTFVQCTYIYSIFIGFYLVFFCVALAEFMFIAIGLGIQSLGPLLDYFLLGIGSLKLVLDCCPYLFSNFLLIE